MTQAEFMRRLDDGLSALPFRRREEIADDMRRHFEEGRAIGHDEHELSAMLGNPEELARDYLVQEGVDPARRVEKRRGCLGTVAVLIGLFFLDLCLALPVFISLWAIWFALAATAISLVIAGGLVFVATIASIFVPGLLYVGNFFLLYIFGAIFCVSAGLLLCYATWALMKRLARGTMKFIRWNGYALTGRRASL